MLDGPDPLTTRTARQRIGGRWALAWQTYLITGGLGVVAVLAGEAQTTAQALPILPWLALAFAGACGIGLVLIIFNLTIFRNRRTAPLPIWVVVLADGFLGLVFSVVVGVGASLLEVPTSTGLVERALLNMLYAMWWGPTLSYFMDLREQWAQEREELVAESVQMELSASQQSDFMDRLQRELDAEINSELNPARERVEDLQRNLHQLQMSEVAQTRFDWEEAASVLRGTAENAIRPLSRQLWREDTSAYPVMRWWTLLANIVRHQPFRPLAFAAIDIVGTFSPLIRTFGITRGLTLLFVGLAWTVLLMMVGNGLMRRFPKHHPLIFIGVLFALQTTVLLRGHFRELWVPGSAPASWVVTQVVAGILVVLVTSGFGAWWDQRTELRATLREEIRSDHVQAMARSHQVAMLARETSQVLHGSVQTRLVSCAMAIDQASASGNTELLNAALNEAIAVLDQPVPGPSSVRTLQDEVSRKVALWEGLCAFQVDIDSPLLASQTEGSVAIGRIVEEGIANAIRHGKATRIQIDISRLGPSTVRIIVTDNGRGPQGGEPGVGSAFVQQASSNRWTLSSLDTGSRLEVDVSA